MMKDYQRGLTREFLREHLHYEPLSGDWTWLTDRSSKRAGSSAGCFSSRGYKVINLDGWLYYAHRLAWFYMTSEWPPEEIDHRDMNKRNNRWENLRLATASQNKRNVVKRRVNKTGFKGVTLVDGKYHRASIRINGKPTLIGYFDSPQKAHAAYVKEAQRLSGDFARTE